MNRKGGRRRASIHANFQGSGFADLDVGEINGILNTVDATFFSVVIIVVVR